MVTELYDSGCSRHITPYRSKLINYMEITPKTISAAGDTTFEAIGRGDLKIKIPGTTNAMTEILLKDVLHAPRISLTLVSVSKIAASGSYVSFHLDECRIFNGKKLIGKIQV